MTRRAFDFYPTPGWATQELLKRVNISGAVLEPCAGKGDISNELRRDARIRVVNTNDVDKNHGAGMSADATDGRWWSALGTHDWVVTNPPFSLAEAILPLAWKHSSVGVAMLLRVTYLEPCQGRAQWLAENPPHKLIVLPRISFTGDGKTDSATCGWFVWDHYCCGQSIQIVTPTSEQQPSLLTA